MCVHQRTCIVRYASTLLYACICACIRFEHVGKFCLCMHAFRTCLFVLLVHAHMFRTCGFVLIVHGCVSLMLVRCAQAVLEDAYSSANEVLSSCACAHFEHVGSFYLCMYMFFTSGFVLIVHITVRKCRFFLIVHAPGANMCDRSNCSCASLKNVGSF